MPKIPLTLDRFKEDKFIIGYIRTSIRNEFLKICKQNANVDKCCSIDNEALAATLRDPDDDFPNFWCDCMLRDIKALLPRQEFDIFKMKYIGFSETEIARVYGVTRQAICKRLKAIRAKIISKILAE